MVEYITPSRLRARARFAINEEASIVRKAQQRAPASSTFLSHSTKDSAILPEVIKLLEDHGASVYVDKKDPALPPITSRVTASTLRDRLRQSRKFILLTSPNSKDSRWMPWELGLADGYRSPQNVAILPTPETAQERAWSEQEYLGIYDRIVYGALQGQAKEVYMVWNQEENSAIELSAWLRR